MIIKLVLAHSRNLGKKKNKRSRSEKTDLAFTTQWQLLRF